MAFEPGEVDPPGQYGDREHDAAGQRQQMFVVWIEEQPQPGGQGVGPQPVDLEAQDGVPIVEEGRPEDDPIVLHVLGDYLGRLQRFRPSALILGCTHYPLLARAIAKLMGPETELISSARAAASTVGTEG